MRPLHFLLCITVDGFLLCDRKYNCIIVGYLFRFSNTNNYADSGEIYSTGWPSNYRQSYSSCIFKISKSAVYQGVYVVFMDVDMYNTYSYKDGVQLFGECILDHSHCCSDFTLALTIAKI